MDNKMRLEFLAKSENEGFARVSVSAFIAQLDPTIEELTDIKTAVSEAVTNAIIHGYECDESKVVIIEASICEDEISITVEDNGIGIPKDKINEIFNRFYQVSDTLKKHEEGSGIGLCIVEEIVNLHGGKINVYSEVNKGTKFEIILPIYTVEKNFKNLQIKDIQQIVKLEMSDVDTKEN